MKTSTVCQYNYNNNIIVYKEEKSFSWQKIVYAHIHHTRHTRLPV